MKILNYNKLLCIIIWVKIYYSEKELKHFGLEILVIHSEKKNIWTIHKDFWAISSD